MIIPITHSKKRTANLLLRIAAKLKSAIGFRRRVPWQRIPVIINNFNRLEYLREQLAWLEKAGHECIYIIDNASTFPPLLEFYKSTKYTVFRLDQNVGHEALWRTHLQMYFCNNYYIYTDPDVVPVKDCPLDAVKHFLDILQAYPEYDKVGFSLKIDDIPEYYEHREKVLKWESAFWEDEVAPGLFKAKIDTTFALYRPGVKNQAWKKTLRTGPPFTARHLPWYVNVDQLSKEEQYYRHSATTASSWIVSYDRYKDEA